jgi:hypothetical protein
MRRAGGVRAGEGVSRFDGFYNQRASPLQTKSRQIQAKPNKFAFYAWICLVELGLFKGLRGKKTKTFSCLRTRASGCDRTSFPHGRKPSSFVWPKARAR